LAKVTGVLISIFPLLLVFGASGFFVPIFWYFLGLYGLFNEILRQDSLILVWKQRIIGLLQRVTHASVTVQGRMVGSIGPGLLVLVGVRPSDDEASALRLLARVLQYRVFGDAEGKMNLSLGQVQGELLLVPQFTLAADTHKGSRPGFSTAAPPELARRLFEGLVSAAQAQHGRVQSGVFGAHMEVSLTNDGPVTLWLESN
jgi:D-aminoacyl-tRNA deacylase